MQGDVYSPNEAFAKLVSLVKTAQAGVDNAVKVVVGSYTGDGSSSRKIQLAFTPKAVLVICDGGEMAPQNGGQGYWGGLATAEFPARAGRNASMEVITITSYGFYVYYYPYSPYAYTNFLNDGRVSGKYNYIAIG